MNRKDIVGALADIDKVLSCDLSQYPKFEAEVKALREVVACCLELDDQQIKDSEGNRLSVIVAATARIVECEIAMERAPAGVKYGPLAKWLDFPWRAAWDEEEAEVIPAV